MYLRKVQFIVLTELSDLQSSKMQIAQQISLSESPRITEVNHKSTPSVPAKVRYLGKIRLPAWMDANAQ